MSNYKTMLWKSVTIPAARSTTHTRGVLCFTDIAQKMTGEADAWRTSSLSASSAEWVRPPPSGRSVRAFPPGSQQTGVIQAALPSEL